MAISLGVRLITDLNHREPFRLPVRVYYEDTDAAGIVYHARYLHFAERGRTEFLRTVGFDHQGLRQSHDLVFAVHRLEMSFRQPAKLDDLLEVRSFVTEMRGPRLGFEQPIYREEQLICGVRVSLAILNTDLRPCRLPPDLKSAFQAYVLE